MISRDVIDQLWSIKDFAFDYFVLLIDFNKMWTRELLNSTYQFASSFTDFSIHTLIRVKDFLSTYDRPGNIILDLLTELDDNHQSVFEFYSGHLNFIPYLIRCSESKVLSPHLFHKWVSKNMEFVTNNIKRLFNLSDRVLIGFVYES